MECRGRLIYREVRARPRCSAGAECCRFGFSAIKAALDDENLIAGVLGIASGAAGYGITTFSMKPILQYRELRTKIFPDFVYYAQVVSADGLSDRMKGLYEERIIASRAQSKGSRSPL